MEPFQHLHHNIQLSNKGIDVINNSVRLTRGGQLSRPVWAVLSVIDKLPSTPAVGLIASESQDPYFSRLGVAFITQEISPPQTLHTSTSSRHFSVSKSWSDATVSIIRSFFARPQPLSRWQGSQNMNVSFMIFCDILLFCLINKIILKTRDQLLNFIFLISCCITSMKTVLNSRLSSPILPCKTMLAYVSVILVYI